jgi:hypothetical protein
LVILILIFSKKMSDFLGHRKQLTLYMTLMFTFGYPLYLYHVSSSFLFMLFAVGKKCYNWWVSFVFEINNLDGNSFKE